MELATKRTLPDTVEWVKVSSVAWHGDGFYYSRYPEPAEGAGEGVDQREPPGLLPQARHAAVAGRARLRGSTPTRSASTCSTRPRTSGSRSSISERGKGKDGNALFVRDLSKPATRTSRRSSRDRQRHLRRRRQRRRQAARRDQSRRAELARGAHRSRASRRRRTGQTVLRGAAGADRERHARRRQAVRDLPERRDHARLRPLPRRQARERDRAAWPRRGGRLRRPARRAVRVLLVQLAERAADDLSLRHRDARRARFRQPKVPATTPRSSRRSRCSTRARTARRSRCSWSIARG